MKPVGSRKDAGSLARSGASTRLVGILISIGPDQLGGSGELTPKEERDRDEHGNGRLNHQAARVGIDVGKDHLARTIGYGRHQPLAPVAFFLLMLARYFGVSHPILLAAYAVLVLYTDNLDFTLPSDLVRPMVLALICGAVSLSLAAVVLHDIGLGAIVATMLVIVLFFLCAPVSDLVHVLALLMPADAGPTMDGLGVVVGFGIAALIAGSATAVLALAARQRGLVGRVNSALTVGVLVLVLFQVVRVGGYLAAAP